jgi:hypothetical protein
VGDWGSQYEVDRAAIHPTDILTLTDLERGTASDGKPYQRQQHHPDDTAPTFSTELMAPRTTPTPVPLVDRPLPLRQMVCGFSLSVSLDSSRRWLGTWLFYTYDEFTRTVSLLDDP